MKDGKLPDDSDRQRIQMTPEEFLWWVVEKRGFTQEQVRNDPAIQRIVREEADRRNDEVVLRVMDELARNQPPRPVEEFVPSDNYRRCRWRDRPEYEFNRSQALMVQTLHEDFLRGGTGLSDAKLFAATKLRRRQKRVEHVFRNFKKGAWVTHAALTDGFLIHASGVWRLNLEKHEKHKD